VEQPHARELPTPLQLRTAARGGDSPVAGAATAAVVTTAEARREDPSQWPLFDPQGNKALDSAAEVEEARASEAANPPEPHELAEVAPLLAPDAFGHLFQVRPPPMHARSPRC
jgi:hypothetical protein